MLILAVEDEVTGTGSLVHRLIFGVTEKDGKIEVLRDWELLQLMNAPAVRGALCAGPATEDAEAVIERYKEAFDAGISFHVPMLRRPSSWPEMLFLPSEAR